MPYLKSLNLQIVFLGSGDVKFEKELSDIAIANPEQVVVKIGYDEVLAHKITAAADFFIMPSRFEPCGLNQMYSQHYGTVPIVRKTGGLADTVIDDSSNSKYKTRNTGIIFEQDNSDDLLKAIIRGLELFKNKEKWKQIQINAMRQDFSWKKSALQYIDLYTQIFNSNDKELSL